MTLHRHHCETCLSSSACLFVCFSSRSVSVRPVISCLSLPLSCFCPPLLVSLCSCHSCLFPSFSPSLLFLLLSSSLALFLSVRRSRSFSVFVVVFLCACVSFSSLPLCLLISLFSVVCLFVLWDSVLHSCCATVSRSTFFLAFLSFVLSILSALYSSLHPLFICSSSIPSLHYCSP